MVLGSAGLALGGLRWTGRAGLTLPLGRTEPDPFALGDLGIAHEHIQMGTGTVNPVFAVEVSGTWGPWRAGGFGFTQQVVYDNSKGYRAGDRYAGGVTLRRGFGAWGARGGIEVQGETAERWGGIAHTDDGNRGRIDAMVAAGGSWSATRQLTLDLAVKIPVITPVVGGQLDMPAIVELGASWSFGKPEPVPAHDHADHDHADHDHADHDHADTTGLDVVDVGPPGTAVELVPVPGKITIPISGRPGASPADPRAGPGRSGAPAPGTVPSAGSTPSTGIRKQSRVPDAGWIQPAPPQDLRCHRPARARAQPRARQARCADRRRSQARRAPPHTTGTTSCTSPAACAADPAGPRPHHGHRAWIRAPQHHRAARQAGDPQLRAHHRSHVRH
jgi:hypothetical protein